MDGMHSDAADAGYARTVYRRRIPWRDVDAAGVWRFVAALMYVEEAETQLIRELGIAEELGIFMPRVRVEADFKHPGRFDDAISVVLQTERVGERSLRYAFMILIDGHPDPAVTGKLVTVLMGEDGTPRPIPASVRNRLQRQPDDGQSWSPEAARND